MLIAKKINPETGEITEEVQEIALTTTSSADSSEETNALTRLEDVLHVVEASFDLPANHDFTVVAFNARKYLITLSNRNFEFSVTIKNPEDFDL